MQAAQARQMWMLAEPVHAVTYFSAEGRAAFTEAGLRGFWRGYFAGRAAPLGPVGPAPVIASFFTFAPSMVTRALPAVWDLATPQEALRARSAGATAALRRVLTGLGDDLPAQVSRAADGLSAAMAGVNCAGRVLAAANAALPVPDEPLARLWQAATVLREHRGDGHFAALVAAGLGRLRGHGAAGLPGHRTARCCSRYGAGRTRSGTRPWARWPAAAGSRPAAPSPPLAARRTARWKPPPTGPRPGPGSSSAPAGVTELAGLLDAHRPGLPRRAPLPQPHRPAHQLHPSRTRPGRARPGRARAVAASP